ncbi:hypothetical protein SCP_0303150 [Sparassis crispa]|uniref:Chloride channel protein n=1 Tax=Sparassis crispa TaxID=139825 RepID=A0A401GEJ9_9APHY|nr:hypothetical protein SCP_0303150 [Sparassis crispa]GBE80600.1 hypothetical protein SCP_0303150 [Sparassis crispa]
MADDGLPSGPYSGPSRTTWRRQRLLRIGSETSTTDGDRAPLCSPTAATVRPSYGTAPPQRRSSVDSGRPRRTRSVLSILGLVKSSVPSSPVSHPPSIRESYLASQRPISAYDAPVVQSPVLEEPEPDVTINGVRVWYASFTSIDWLHDAIKDSARRARLRRPRSRSARLRRQLDRTVGWLIVTIVGFFTAVAAFLIIRTEQWLFDLKDGYCRDAWWKARRFCCPAPEDVFATRPAFLTLAEDESCPAWRTWPQVFEPMAVENGSWLQVEMMDYLAYTVVALSLAVISCLLTIHLTASTSFVTRKDSAVVPPEYAHGEGDQKVLDNPNGAEQKRKVMYYAAGSGIPEIKTILSGFVIHGYLGARTLFTKSIGLALSVGSGLTLGKEGPFVHIASCVGNIVSRFFSKYETNEAKRREILSAASAAGVAVAFGAPIGGVLFSLEEVSYFFPPKVMWRSFFCAMVAAMTLRFLDPFGSGKLVLLQVTYDKDWHAYELIFFLLLGVFGGVWGAYFSKMNFLWTRHVRNGTWLRRHPVLEVVLVTLATSVLCFVNPYTRWGNTELVYKLFCECAPGAADTHGLCVLDPPQHALPVIRAILVAMLIKGALTVVTFGIKLPAGIFIPSLAVGACAGRIVGILVQWLQFTYPDSPVFAACKGDLDCVIPGLYAMVGAAASLSGVTRTTVSLAVIMFELTDTLTYAVPVMLAVLVAKTVADAIAPKGIYDLCIELAQLPYLDAKHDYGWGSVQIIDVTDRDVDVIRVDVPNTVKSLRDRLQRLLTAGKADGGFPILRAHEDGHRMVGYIGASELEHGLCIIADEPEKSVSFHPAAPYAHGSALGSSYSSLEAGAHVVGADPFDFSCYMDQAPLTVQSNSPLELVQQFFTKLGARYVVVMDTDGYYEGVIDKKAWLAFLGELEEKAASK